MAEKLPLPESTPNDLFKMVYTFEGARPKFIQGLSATSRKRYTKDEVQQGKTAYDQVKMGDPILAEFTQSEDAKGGAVPGYVVGVFQEPAGKAPFLLQLINGYNPWKHPADYFLNMNNFYPGLKFNSPMVHFLTYPTHLLDQLPAEIKTKLLTDGIKSKQPQVRSLLLEPAAERFCLYIKNGTNLTLKDWLKTLSDFNLTTPRTDDQWLALLTAYHQENTYTQDPTETARESYLQSQMFEDWVLYCETPKERHLFLYGLDQEETP